MARGIFLRFFHSLDPEDPFLHSKFDLQSGKGHAIDPVRVSLIVGAGIAGQDTPERLQAVRRNLVQKLRRDLHFQPTGPDGIALRRLRTA